MKIAYFKTLGNAKVFIRSAGQTLDFDFPAGVVISITHDPSTPHEAINFQKDDTEVKPTS